MWVDGTEWGNEVVQDWYGSGDKGNARRFDMSAGGSIQLVGSKAQVWQDSKGWINMCG